MQGTSTAGPNAIGAGLGAMFGWLALSRWARPITSLSPGVGEWLSKHSVSAGDIGALLARLVKLQQKAAARLGKVLPIIAIQEPGVFGLRR